MKTTPAEKNKQKPKTRVQKETDKEKAEMEGLENLYTFQAGASCGLYSMGDEFWENLGEKINPTNEKEKTKDHKPTTKNENKNPNSHNWTI